MAFFAAAGFLLLGLSDLVVDLIWIWGRARRLAVPGPVEPDLDDLAPAAPSSRFAVFVPAWDEAGVIGEMLAHALRTWGDADFTLYVGCYPNDPATQQAAARVADPRVRLVVGREPGPTTKAGCLNTLWTAMLADEGGGKRRHDVIVLHDSEDVVHGC